MAVCLLTKNLQSLKPGLKERKSDSGPDVPRLNGFKELHPLDAQSYLQNTTVIEFIFSHSMQSESCFDRNSLSILTCFQILYYAKVIVAVSLIDFWDNTGDSSLSGCEKGL